MYSIGDIIVYTTYGLCKIDSITEKEFNGSLMDYYILKPVNDPKASLLVQVDSPITREKIKVLLTKDEILELIHSFPNIEPYWIENENERKKHFSATLRAGNRPEILAIIKSVYEHSKGLKDKGRKLHACDEQAYKDAEKLIFEEISFVMEIDKTQVKDFIIDEIGGFTN